MFTSSSFFEAPMLFQVSFFMRSSLLRKLAVSSLITGTLYASTSTTVRNDTDPIVTSWTECTDKAFGSGNPFNWTKLKLLKYEDVAPDARKFTFALPHEHQVVGFQPCSMMLANLPSSSWFKPLIRPYTPISSADQKGEVQFLIKKVPNGQFTTPLYNLKVNDTVSFSGPMKRFDVKPNQFTNITLIGGGSGITPLYQLLRHVSDHPYEHTKVHLIYGNKTPKDILLKKELDLLTQKYPDRIKVSYFIDQDDGSDIKDLQKGYITKEWLASNIEAPSPFHKVFICGPPALYKSVCGKPGPAFFQGKLGGALKELGFTKDQVFKF